MLKPRLFKHSKRPLYIFLAILFLLIGAGVVGYLQGRHSWQQRYANVVAGINEFQPPEGAIPYYQGWTEQGKGYVPFGLACIDSQCPDITHTWLVAVKKGEENTFSSELLRKYGYKVELGRQSDCLQAGESPWQTKCFELGNKNNTGASVSLLPKTDKRADVQKWPADIPGMQWATLQISVHDETPH
jgi:hypothetical protein